MGNAEQGGTGGQRMLLIGGPKHGDFMNHPHGTDDYEFTSSETLLPFDGRSGWSNYPQTATHRYRYDDKLTNRLSASRLTGATLNIFTHESLWNTPYQGGFNLHALTEALRALDAAKAEQDALLEAQKTTSNKICELEDACEDWQNKYEKLLDGYEQAHDQLRNVRQHLELALRPIIAAVDETGYDYKAVIAESRAE